MNPHTNQSWHILLQLKQRARSLTPTGIRSLRSGAEILRDVHESTKALVKGEFSFPERKLSLSAFFFVEMSCFPLATFQTPRAKQIHRSFQQSIHDNNKPIMIDRF